MRADLLRPATWAEVLRRLLWPTRALAPAEATAIERERGAANLRRIRVMAPIGLCAHLAYMAVFGWWHQVAPERVAWRDTVFGLHAVAAPIATALLIASWWARPRWLDPVRRWAGEITVLDMIALGTLSALNTNRTEFSMAPFLIAAMIVAIAVTVRPAFALLVIALAGAALVGFGVLRIADPAARSSTLTNAVISIALVFVLGRLGFGNLMREVRARHTIERINGELERRVAAQVGEIVARAREVEALNLLLADQVRERSRELSAAIRRLAAHGVEDEPLAIGAILADRFTIESTLAVGGMGVVYAARDTATDHRVAVKLIRDLDGGVEAAHRFLQEAGAAASVAHPAIVRVIHVDVTRDGQLFQVQELIDGRTLEGWLAEVGRMPPVAVADLGAVLADAIATAHDAGVVHRDVKPANVMLTRAAPHARLLDFGLSKLRRGATDDRTARGLIVGTPAFIAPEQITDPDQVGDPVDVYALGLVLYGCACGDGPFPASSPMEWLTRHVHDAPAPLGPRVPGAPPALCEAIMACLAKDPRARPTARALASALAAVAEPDALATTLASAGEPDRAPADRAGVSVGA